MNDRRVSLVALGPVHFAKIPDEDWYQPNWINETLATEERQKMQDEGIIYADSVSSVFVFVSCLL